MASEREKARIRRVSRCRRRGHERPTPEAPCARCGARTYSERGTGVTARAKTPRLNLVERIVQTSAPVEPAAEPSLAAAPLDRPEASPPITDFSLPDPVLTPEPAANSGPAAALNDTAQALPQTRQDAPGGAIPPPAAATPQADPASALNAEAAGTAPGPAPAPPVRKPSVLIPNAIARAGVAKGLAWLGTKGSFLSLRRFMPKNKDGSRFRPGPATIPVTDEMLEAFDMSEAERRELGVTPSTPLEYPVSDVLAEGVRVELERLGWVNDIELHPLLVIFGGLLAIPACMVLRSPDFDADADAVEPAHDKFKREQALNDAAEEKFYRDTPSPDIHGHGSANGEPRSVPSLHALRGSRVNRPREKEPA